MTAFAEVSQALLSTPVLLLLSGMGILAYWIMLGLAPPEPEVWR